MSQPARGCVERGARLTHLLDCTLAAAGRHRTCGVRNDDRIEPFSTRVQHGRANADILRQTADPHSSDPSLSQFRCESGLIERRILIPIEADAFRDDNGIRRELQGWMESSARAVLHAVDRPLSSGFLETDMVPRMPVSRRTNGHVSLSRRTDPAVQHRNNVITAFDWHRAARTEVDLNVHGNERVTGAESLAWIGHVA